MVMTGPDPGLPDDSEVQLLLDGNFADVVFLAVGMAILMALLWGVYRTMQHPRLPINEHPDRAPTATWPGVLRYLLTIPVMVTFWMIVYLLLLSAAAADRTGADVIVAATAVIGGARLLAHMKVEIAHELAKTVPIAILGFVIIGGGFTGAESFVRQFDDALAREGIIDNYLLGLIVFDVVLTAVWFGAVRWRWLRTERRADAGRPVEGFFGRLGDRWRRIGYSHPTAAPPPETERAR